MNSVWLNLACSSSVPASWSSVPASEGFTHGSFSRPMQVTAEWSADWLCSEGLTSPNVGDYNAERGLAMELRFELRYIMPCSTAVSRVRVQRARPRSTADSRVLDHAR
jgi:hypothetical protein